jgi:L-aminopeptidase/D-esterase-like protein
MRGLHNSHRRRRSIAHATGACVTALLCATALAQSAPTPDTTVRGPVLEFDFPEIHIGVAEYADGPTGATVFYFPEPVKAAIDVRGGAPGVVNSEALRLGADASFTRAVCFAGGSSFGLSAATGVANALKDRLIAQGEPSRIAFVAGAIIFDVGGRRFSRVTPDDALGRAALHAAAPGAFPLGAQGAGRFAMQGSFFGTPQHSGQGGAFRQVGEIKVAVFTVVNPGGAVINRDGALVLPGPSGPRTIGSISEALEEFIDRRLAPEPAPADQGVTSNTTITLVATNAKLPIVALQRLAIQVHGSMARAIQPFATRGDGDTLIAVTTDQVEFDPSSLASLGALASEVAWDAVLASVPRLPDDPMPAPAQWTDAELDAVVGEYRFTDWASMRIERRADGLVAIGPAMLNYYFPEDEPAPLIPLASDELLIEPDQYRLRIVREDGAITGLTLEPGPWAQFAKRVNSAE